MGIKREATYLGYFTMIRDGSFGLAAINWKIYFNTMQEDVL